MFQEREKKRDVSIGGRPESDIVSSFPKQPVKPMSPKWLATNYLGEDNKLSIRIKETI